MTIQGDNVLFPSSPHPVSYDIMGIGDATCLVIKWRDVVNCLDDLLCRVITCLNTDWMSSQRMSDSVSRRHSWSSNPHRIAVNLNPITLTFHHSTQNDTTCEYPKVILYTMVWTLWNCSFLNYAEDKHTNKQTDRQTDRQTEGLQRPHADRRSRRLHCWDRGDATQ